MLDLKVQTQSVWTPRPFYLQEVFFKGSVLLNAMAFKFCQLCFQVFNVIDLVLLQISCSTA